MTFLTRFPRGLYGITPEWNDTDHLLDAIRAAAHGGMCALQVRRKTTLPAHAPSRQEHARLIVALCRELKVVSIVNDDWQLALDVEADGVHLGQNDGDVAIARQRLGPTKLIGVSCYDDMARARAALAAGADVIAFGAVYPSPTKPQAVHAPLERLAQARTLTDALPNPRPVVAAIGGITPANAAPVVRAGADAIALISGLFEADDVEAAARRCASLFTS